MQERIFKCANCKKTAWTLPDPLSARTKYLWSNQRNQIWHRPELLREMLQRTHRPEYPWRKAKTQKHHSHQRRNSWFQHQPAGKSRGENFRHDKWKRTQNRSLQNKRWFSRNNPCSVERHNWPTQSRRRNLPGKRICKRLERRKANNPGKEWHHKENVTTSTIIFPYRNQPSF